MRPLNAAWSDGVRDGEIERMRERGETTNAKRNMCSCHPTMCIISTPLPSPSRSLIPLCLPALLPSLLSLSFRYYTCVLTLITYVVLSYAFITHIVWLWLIFFIAHGKKENFFIFLSASLSLSLIHKHTVSRKKNLLLSPSIYGR